MFWEVQRPLAVGDTLLCFGISEWHFWPQEHGRLPWLQMLRAGIIGEITAINILGDPAENWVDITVHLHKNRRGEAGWDCVFSLALDRILLLEK